MAGADEDLSKPDKTAPDAEADVTQGSKITAAKFTALIDMIDDYMGHSHTFSDEYNNNCQCQCGRGSI